MGQKVSPIGLHVGAIHDREFRWYTDKDYAGLLLEDVKIREFLFVKCKNAPMSRVEIERSKNRVEIMTRTARPGVIIGVNGENVKMLKKKVEKLTGGKNIYLKILEITNPDLSTRLATRSIADQLEQCVSFCTTREKAIQKTMRAGAEDIETAVSGRLGGADITRTGDYSEDAVPLHTLCADIDYTWGEVSTTCDRLGVKVWVCHGEVLPGQIVQKPEAPKNNMNDRRRNRRGNRGGDRNSSQRSNNDKSSTGGNAPGKTEGGR